MPSLQLRPLNQGTTLNKMTHRFWALDNEKNIIFTNNFKGGVLVFDIKTGAVLADLKKPKKCLCAAIASRPNDDVCSRSDFTLM